MSQMLALHRLAQAQAALRAGRPRVAALVLDAVDVTPGIAGSCRLRAEICHALGDRDGSIRAARASLQAQPDDGSTAALLANLLSDNGDIARSVEALEQAIAAGAAGAALHSARAGGLLALGRAADAAAAARQGLASHPDHPHLLRALARAGAA